MPVPTYDQFIAPIFKHLAAHPDGDNVSEVYEAAATTLGLTSEDKAELLPSGTQAIYKNRAGWAHDRLKRTGLSASPRRGYWKLTQKGIEYSQRYQSDLPAEVVAEIADSWRTVPRTNAAADVRVAPVATMQSLASPDDRLEEALFELTDKVAEDLLSSISEMSPQFFENLVLDLLYAMGYGTSRADLQRVGRAGDGGIDGIISLDRLGLERVYVQAKRWKDATVGRPAVQSFYGALAAQHAKKGVFITTSRFLDTALEYARSVEGLVLIAGNRLADLMIEHGVGVSHRVVKVPKIDVDYFSEE